MEKAAKAPDAAVDDTLKARPAATPPADWPPCSQSAGSGPPGPAAHEPAPPAAGRPKPTPWPAKPTAWAPPAQGLFQEVRHKQAALKEAVKKLEAMPELTRVQVLDAVDGDWDEVLEFCS